MQVFFFRKMELARKLNHLAHHCARDPMRSNVAGKQQAVIGWWLSVRLG
ncbi:hypothetical protein M3O57_06820 [Xanthomonas nasturtii]|uniref:Helicase n=1 Tax=Xanthomonas nasturtii TaxID=1843581 RepID=A0ABT0LM09_9XANT|nr:hypothetical protein [Xanthomonas nasturtii]MCL1502410.1 hypothetical protein [Xanthomonas nasturtii]MCL1522143.1 hypothetical protein [Xanthomonas nasturtii]MCL1550398.1 hypothetical protein [Xanthomonas nasturtii]MCL1554622.1 hypothetical protein [Xanthomonas nasturtii]MCL1568917.1 hypothetical protein [Xanthomonas nasturtii]